MNKTPNANTAEIFEKNIVKCASCQHLPELKKMPNKINLLGKDIKETCPNCGAGALRAEPK